MGATRGRAGRQSRLATLLVTCLCAVVTLAGCGAASEPGAPAGVGASIGVSNASAVKVFDPSVGAPLPNDRILVDRQRIGVAILLLERIAAFQQALNVCVTHGAYPFRDA